MVHFYIVLCSKLTINPSSWLQNTHAHQAQGSHPMFTSNGIPFNLFPPGSSPSPEFFANFINRGPDHGQPPSGHSISINLNDIFGQANANASGQGSSQTGNPNTPPASFPTGAAVPPFAFSGSGNEGNQAHPASSGHEREHGEPGIHINLTGPEQAAEALRTVMQMFGPQMDPHEGAPRGLLLICFIYVFVSLSLFKCMVGTEHSMFFFLVVFY
jgi:small glutamine-rich tetratricopeptide repeat-containing protein alpha